MFSFAWWKQWSAAVCHLHFVLTVIPAYSTLICYQWTSRTRAHDLNSLWSVRYEWPSQCFCTTFLEQQWYHHAYIIYYYYLLGLTKCNECSWNNGQIRLAWLKKPFVVHPSNMCNKRRWIIWRSWLAFQWVEKEKKLKVKVRKSLHATRHIWEWPLGWKKWKHSLTLKQLWL